MEVRCLANISEYIKGMLAGMWIVGRFASSRLVRDGQMSSKLVVLLSFRRLQAVKKNKVQLHQPQKPERLGICSTKRSNSKLLDPSSGHRPSLQSEQCCRCKSSVRAFRTSVHTFCFEYFHLVTVILPP
jgi:hypothetical protein